MDKKLFFYGALVVVIFFLIGIAVQHFIPGCHCDEGAGCGGCGMVGNFFAGFSFACMVFGLIGFVLLIWFGIPALLLFLILYAIYSLLTKSGKDKEEQSDSESN